MTASHSRLVGRRTTVAGLSAFTMGVVMPGFALADLVKSATV